MVASGCNFLTFPGARGATLYFEYNEGHFYRDMKCADSQFFSLREPPEKAGSPKKAQDCGAKPGMLHDHEVPPRKLVELATLRWACILRVLLHHDQESLSQSIDATISSWPHKPPIELPQIHTKFHAILGRFKGELKNGKDYARNISNRHGNEHFLRFSQIIFQPQPYWTSPIPKNSGNFYFLSNFYMDSKLILLFYVGHLHN